MNLVTFDQGKASSEEISFDLIANIALIVKRYKETISNRVESAQFKGGSATRRSTSEKKKLVELF